MKNIQTYWLNEHLWNYGEYEDGEITMLVIQETHHRINIALNLEGGVISVDDLLTDEIMISGGYRRITQEKTIDLLDDKGVSYDMDDDIVLVSEENCF